VQNAISKEFGSNAVNNGKKKRRRSSNCSIHKVASTGLSEIRHRTKVCRKSKSRHSIERENVTE
jgi:hypothetical protein